MKKSWFWLITAIMLIGFMTTAVFAEDTIDEWDGSTDVTWYNDTDTEFTITTAEQLAGLAELVDGGNTFEGKTIKLYENIDLCSKIFEPIGSYRKELSFKGTFDGQGHTIYNLSQNTWELDNGYSYSDLGLGLFGKIEDATVKNLIMDGANISGESAICGTVAAAAYGDCIFENITVSNSNVADYQYYAGGIVGWASGDHQYINCCVDETSVIAAQWGDFDNSTGGVIGGCGGNATIYMKDCYVACRIDAYNDVTSSYQWYAYRRCGMLIGNPGITTTNGNTTYASAPQLTAENCTVIYGEWANYTYCEFAGKNWPYVRVQAGISNSAYSNPRYGHPTDANGNEVVDDNHVHNEGEDHFIECTFDQLYGGGQGVYGEPTHAGVTVIHHGEEPVASIGRSLYLSISDAVEAANDGDEITIISDIALTTENYVVNSDGYATLVNVADKAVTIDLNGKSITVEASAADFANAKNTMLMSVFSADTNGKLTLKDNVGTASVSVTANDATVYSLVCAYSGLINIESGSYFVDRMGEGRGMIYSNISGDCSGADGSNLEQGINVSGGTFTLGNIGTLANGSPWIFNVSGTGTPWIMVSGGTFNANVQRQFWANEAMIPVTHYIEKNEDNTWTVKTGAALYAVEGTLTGPYYIADWKIGYPSLEAFIDAANAGDPITIDLNDPLTLLKDMTVTTPTDISEMILNQNDKIITLSENGTLTVSGDAEIVPVAVLGYNLVTTANADGTTTYSVERVAYTVTYTDGVENEVIFEDQVLLAECDDVTPLFGGTPTRDGYTFIGWTPDIAPKVTEDIVYTAIWEENSGEKAYDNLNIWYMMLLKIRNQIFEVTADATDGGTITPEGITEVKYDNDITYTITPDEGCMIADVIVDGESVGAVSEYTFKGVREAHTITVVFSKNQI